MRAAVIGAGVAGLAVARVLLDAGLDVTVFEERADLGGVWSATRGYPGLRTQNDGASYAFSDLPMGTAPHEQATAAHVNAYLASYARVHGIDRVLRLGTRVATAAWRPREAAWHLETTSADGPDISVVDWLVLATGITRLPHMPSWEGVEDFEAAGGRVVHASELTAQADLGGQRVLVVGWGKSAADVAVAAAAAARSTTIVARAVQWKMPYRVGSTPFQRLVNTRLGEHLLWAPAEGLSGRVLRWLDRGARKAVVERLEGRVRKQLRLDARGLTPDGSIAGFTHLVTPGFFEDLDSGRIDGRLNASVERLSGGDGPVAHLSDGTALVADLIVAATGFDQDLVVLDAATRSRLLDAEGRLLLQRHTVPAVPGLLFAGWTTSFRSPIVSELQAMWIAALIMGRARRLRSRPTLFQLSQRAAGRRGEPQFSSGTSIADQDAFVRGAGLRVPLRVRLAELVRPMRPSDYASLHAQLQRRLGRQARSADSEPSAARSRAGTK